MPLLDWVNPWVFLALLLLPALYWLMRGSLDGLHPRRRWIALALRTTLFLLLMAALADPRLRYEGNKRALIVLIDQSRSLEGQALEQARTDFSDNAQAKLLKEYDALHWIAFAGKAKVMDGLTTGLTAEELQSIQPLETNLDYALNYASAIASAGMAVDILIYSDGCYTHSSSHNQEQNTNNILTLSKLAKERNFRVFTQVIEPPKRKEVLVQSLNAPRRVRKGEAFEVEARLLATEAGPATIQVFRDGVLVSERKQHMQAGDNNFRYTDTLQSETLSEIAIVVQSEGDTHADNNRMSTLIASSEASRILLITDDPPSANYLGRALRQHEIEMEIRPPRGMPTRMADLRNFGLLIIDNVAASDLSYSQQELLQSYVRDFGGGFLMMGGNKAYGLGGYYRTPVEKLLPVRCDFESQRDTPSLGIALIIDKSGSMQGEKIAMVKEAARAVLSLLSPRDFAGVIAFDNSALWVAPMQRVSDRFGMERLISTIEANGGTNIAPSLELAGVALSSLPAKLKHVILLTDGQSTDGPYYELTNRLVNNKVTVSTVGVGASADIALLQNIARWGKGRHYYTSEARDLPQIFTQETMTAADLAIRELPFTATLLKPAPFIQSIDLTAAPFLYGYVVTEAKPTADVWLTTETGEPLLATWRYGLGKTAAFSSDARNRWALEWLRWQGYGPFWAQLCRYLMRTDSLTRPSTRISHNNNSMSLTIDAVDEQGNYLTDISGRAIITHENGQREEATLRMSAPGRMEADWPSLGQGHYFIDYVLSDDSGNPVINQSIVETIGYPQELQVQAAQPQTLENLAVSTGGKLIQGNELEQGMLKDERTTLEEREIWPYFIALSLLIFIGDVAARRLP